MTTPFTKLFNAAVKGRARATRERDPSDIWDTWAADDGRGEFYRPLYARCIGCEGITRSEAVPPTHCGYCGRAFPKAGHSYDRTFAARIPAGRRHMDHTPGG